MAEGQGRPDGEAVTRVELSKEVERMIDIVAEGATHLSMAMAVRGNPTRFAVELAGLKRANDEARNLLVKIPRGLDGLPHALAVQLRVNEMGHFKLAAGGSA